MLKHTSITRDRARQFIAAELHDRMVAESIPLECEFVLGAFPDEATARKAKGWKKIEKGFMWGPAYHEGWYRVTGTIPEEWKGQEVALGYGDTNINFEKGNMCEGTIWRDNQIVGGLDWGHHHFRLIERAGEGLDLVLQAYAHNKETTVHGAEKPRTELPEEYRGFLLMRLNPDVMQLFFDCEFALNLLEGLDEKDPLYHNVLRALNDICNSARYDNPKSIAAARKLMKEVLGGLVGEMHHSVIPVGHAHLDTAWLWPLSVTRLKMAHTTGVQLDLIERYPEHIFVHSQASQYEWLEEEHPHLLERIKKAMKKGQWEPVGSMWVEADCNLTGSEALVRQFLYGRRWFKQKLGYETVDMWLPDVFGYSAALPQILDKFGIKYFLTQKLSWNQFNKPLHNTFWWEGIDGSKVWVHFPPGNTYVHSCAPKDIIEGVKNHKDHGRSDQSMLVYGHGDGGAGPNEYHVERLRRARMAPGLPMIEKKKRAIDFFREAYDNSRDLMTWKGELYFELHRGTYTSQALTKKNNRDCEFMLRDAEMLACFRDDFAQGGYPADVLEKAWKIVLLNQFHDIIPGSSVKEVYDEAAEDYARAKAMIQPVIEESLRQIGSKLDRSGMKQPFAVFHNSNVPSQVEVPWDQESVPTAVACGDEVLPVQLVEEFGERKLIFETPNAALGSVAVADFATKAPTITNKVKTGNRRLENDSWSVRFDGNGHITSILTLDDQPIEFIAPGGLGNLFQIFDDRPLFWDAWDIDIYALEKPIDLVKSESVELVEKGPVRGAIEIVKRFGQSTIRQRISLGPTPGIRFDTEIDWHETDKMLKVGFPLNVYSHRASFEIQWGHVERPTHRNTSWDWARFEVPCQKWFDLSEGGHGAALLNNGKYGCDVDGNVMRQTLLRSPKAPDPMCDMGVHRFTYVLLPHYDQLVRSEVVAASYALNSVPRHAFLEAGEGAQGQIPALVSVDNANVIVETVKKAEDNKNLLVRLYECHQTRGRAELSCALPVKKAWLADMNEVPQQELEVEGGFVRFNFRPFEILTLVLQV